MNGQATRNALIAGLDLGSAKVSVILAEATSEGLDVLGLGTAPSKGLRNGVVVNIESTVRAIRAALDQVERMAGCQVGVVFAGISGSHVRGLNKDGFVAISDQEVSAADVRGVLKQSKVIPLPHDGQIIHVLPQEYRVDDQGGIDSPVGMSGVRLEARVHLVTAARTSVKNILKCTQRCDLDVAEVVLGPLASAEAVLSDEEKEIGVAVVDIGAGTTGIVVYGDGAVVHTSVVPIGGINFTRDIGTGLRTALAEAERIKIRYGCAYSKMIQPDEKMEVPSVGGRPPRLLPRQLLTEIIEPRAEEVVQSIYNVLAASGVVELLGSGIVMCGGCSLMPGMPELAEHITGLPVRVAGPAGMGGLSDVVSSPAHATGAGLVKYGARRLAEAAAEESAGLQSKPRVRRWPWRGMSSLGNWLRAAF